MDSLVWQITIYGEDNRAYEFPFNGTKEEARNMAEKAGGVKYECKPQPLSGIYSSLIPEYEAMAFSGGPCL